MKNPTLPKPSTKALVISGLVGIATIPLILLIMLHAPLKNRPGNDILGIAAVMVAMGCSSKIGEAYQDRKL